MSSDIYVAASGASARLRDLEVVANNLANVDTIGFKRSRVLFRTALESALLEQDGARVPGLPGRAFVGLRTPGADLSAGAIASTGAPLDVAIRGEGFFALETPRGTRFTRAGSFVTDPDRTLVNREGHAVRGKGGPIRIGPRPAEIRSSGEVVDSSGAVLGRLEVVKFDDPSLLIQEGSTLFRAPDGVEPQPRRAVELAERSLERSNVRPVEELARLIVLQRSFDASMQSLQRQDESLQRLLQEVRP